MRVKCSECPQNVSDKSNEAECKCPCHLATPEVPLTGSLFVWDFRYGGMVDIKTHEIIERMAAK